MPNPKRPSQGDIAKATGVSLSTVSLVLRGGAGASSKAKDKVLTVAKSIGYRPNTMVHTIRSGKSRTIGVLVPPHDTHWVRICVGIHDQLVEKDYLPLFAWNTGTAPSNFSARNAETDEENALRQIHRLLDRWIDGVLLWPDFYTYYAKHLSELESRNIPVVAIDHYIPSMLADSVMSDEESIAETIVTHLEKLEHKHFLIICPETQEYWALRRCQALQQQISKLPDSGSSLLQVPIHREASPDAIVERLKNDPTITAIIVCSDKIAPTVYQAAQMLERPIPDSLSVVGVGNLELGQYLFPALTTVDQSSYAIGQKAAQTLLERSSQLLTGSPRQYVCPVVLKQRQSTAKAR